MTKQLQDAFNYFNERLFEASLPRVPIKIEPIRGGGLGCFITKGGKHQITITPDVLCRGDEDVLSTLVHEMAHLWDELYGSPAPGNEHGRVWIRKMRALGLPPYNLAGKVSHRVAPGGAFTRTYTKLHASGWQVQETPPVAYPAQDRHGHSRPIRHPLRPPLPPRPSTRTIGTQLTNGFTEFGALLSASFHGAIAVLVGWLALEMSDPVFSRWFSAWRTASVWVKQLVHALFT